MLLSSRSTARSISTAERERRNCTSRFTRIFVGPKCIVRGSRALSTAGSFATICRTLATTLGSALSPIRSSRLSQASTEATVIVLHVVHLGREADVGREIAEHNAQWGRKFGAKAEPLVVEGGIHPDESILRIARERGVDLIVLGSGLRVISARAFFGHRIERMLKKAPCAVAIVSAT